MIFRKRHKNTALLSSSSERQQLLERLAILQLELTELTTEREDLHRLVNEFEIQYHKRLGHHIERILELRQERAKRLADSHPEFDSRYQEASDDYDSWHQNYTEIQQKKLFSLCKEDLKLLKLTFRKAAKKCHPDVAREEDKEKSHQLFISLRQAYERNDLDSVVLLAEQIESENIIQQDPRQAEIDSLTKVIATLGNSIESVQTEIKNITGTESYRVLSVYSDTSIYFEEREKELVLQYTELVRCVGAE